jgi:hypothetical protein
MSTCTDKMRNDNDTGIYCSNSYSKWISSSYRLEPYAIVAQWSCTCARHQGVWMCEGRVPLILKFDTRCRWVLCFTPLLLYFWKRAPLYTLNRKFVGPRAELEYLEKRKTLAPPGRQTQIHRFRYRSPVSVQITVPQPLFWCVDW